MALITSGCDALRSDPHPRGRACADVLEPAFCRALPLPCVSTAAVAMAVPLPCVSTAVVLGHCLCLVCFHCRRGYGSAFALCVSTAVGGLDNAFALVLRSVRRPTTASAAWPPTSTSRLSPTCRSVPIWISKLRRSPVLLLPVLLLRLVGGRAAAARPCCGCSWAHHHQRAWCSPPGGRVLGQCAGGPQGRHDPRDQVAAGVLGRRQQRPVLNADPAQPKAGRRRRRRHVCACVCWCVGAAPDEFHFNRQ